MENSQIIALLAIAISLFGIGLAFVGLNGVQSDIRNLNNNLIGQSQTIKSLSSQLNDSNQLINQQTATINDLKTKQNTSQTQINSLQANLTSLENQINSLEERLNPLIPNPNPILFNPCAKPVNPGMEYGIQNATDQNVPTNGLVAEWNFEGNALDTSGHANNGMLCGGVTFVDGKIGKAVKFNGTNGVVSVSNNPSLNFGSTGSFSISLWMKSTQINSVDSPFGIVVDKRRNNDGIYQGYSIEDDSGLLVGRIRDGSANDAPVFSTTNVNDGVFHHIVYVVDRSTQTAKLYVDSSLQNTTRTASVGNIDSSVNLLFGGQAAPNTPTTFFAGILDQIRIYSRALSTSEIQTLFTSGS